MLVAHATRRMCSPRSADAQDHAAGIYRIRKELISGEWASDDLAAVMNQLGVFEPP